MTMYDPDTQGTPEQRRKRDEFLQQLEAPMKLKIIEDTIYMSDFPVCEIRKDAPATVVEEFRNQMKRRFT